MSNDETPADFKLNRLGRIQESKLYDTKRRRGVPHFFRYDASNKIVVNHRVVHVEKKQYSKAGVVYTIYQPVVATRG